MRQFLRRNTFWFVLGLIALVVVGVSAVLRGGTSGSGIPLAADSPAPSGARALVQVLSNEGVDVHVVSSADDARDALAAAPDATLAVFDPAAYLPAERLSDLVGAAERSVVIAPDFGMLQAIAPDIRLAGTPDDTVSPPADCPLPAAQRAERITPGSSFGIDEAAQSAVGCFGSGDGSARTYPVVSAAPGLTLVGSPAVFDNEHIPQQGNAALALGLLGESADLVWYLPTAADIAADGPPTLQALTPTWLVPATSLLALTALVAMFWRGRRFGPLVAEDLPVTVPAGETREGRARLYQRSSARGRAVDALRIGTADRLATRLGLPRAAPVWEVADRAAAVLGRHPGELRALLIDTIPRDDRDVVALSDRLRDLERDIRHATDPLGRNS